MRKEFMTRINARNYLTNHEDNINHEDDINNGDKKVDDGINKKSENNNKGYDIASSPFGAEEMLLIRELKELDFSR